MAVRREERKMPSANGKDTLSGAVFIPEGEPRGMVQISHGMCEYIGRYEELMSFAAENGYVCCGHDHLGHGGTAKSDADLGFIAKKGGDALLVDDVCRFGREIAAGYPGVPRFLLGHSMGSFIARVAAEKLQNELSGLILTGTGGKNPAAGFGIALAGLIQGVRGERYVSKFVNRMATGDFNRRCQGPTSYEWISRDRAIVDKYADDQHCTFPFTVSAMKDLVTLNELSNRKEWFERFPKKLPVALFSGAEDPVGDYGRGVRQVYQRLKAAGVSDVSLTLYPGARHEVLNEINRQAVYNGILLWMGERAKRPRAE